MTVVGSVQPLADPRLDHQRTAIVGDDRYAAGAKLGLLTRTRWLTATCATIAGSLTLLVMYESPGTMLQFG
jgi:hypothetical protein